MAGKRKDVYLVCGGKYHDFDFARLELLKLLAEHDVARVKVANDYSNVEAMCEADLLITYTCDEMPDPAGQALLKSYIDKGGKWFALHATNSVLEWLSHDPPLLRTPRDHPDFMEVLGSQFLAHLSMEAAINVLSQSESSGRKVAILGDMGELGENEMLFHSNLQALLKPFRTVTGRRSKSMGCFMFVLMAQVQCCI